MFPDKTAIIFVMIIIPIEPFTEEKILNKNKIPPKI